MAYKNKTFVSFDGDHDIHYYRLMRAWKQSDSTPFSFYDAHDLNLARDTSLEDSIKAQLGERIRNSKVFVLLIGENTRYLYKRGHLDLWYTGPPTKGGHGHGHVTVRRSPEPPPGGLGFDESHWG